MAVASTIGRARAAGARVEVFYDVVSPYSYLLFETLVRFRSSIHCSPRWRARA